MNCVNCVKCIVKPSAGSWLAQIDSKDYGPYLSRDMALQVAVADAHSRRRSGGDICVIVEGAEGHVCAQRCLCDGFVPSQASGA